MMLYIITLFSPKSTSFDFCKRKLEIFKTSLRFVMAPMDHIENRADIKVNRNLGKTPSEALKIKATARNTSVGSVLVLRDTKGLRLVERVG